MSAEIYTLVIRQFGNEALQYCCDAYSASKLLSLYSFPLQYNFLASIRSIYYTYTYLIGFFWRQWKMKLLIIYDIHSEKLKI